MVIPHTLTIYSAEIFCICQYTLISQKFFCIHCFCNTDIWQIYRSAEPELQIWRHYRSSSSCRPAIKGGPLNRRLKLNYDCTAYPGDITLIFFHHPLHFSDCISSSKTFGISRLHRAFSHLHPISAGPSPWPRPAEWRALGITL